MTELAAQLEELLEQPFDKERWHTMADLAEQLSDQRPLELRSWMLQARVLVQGRMWRTAEANFERAIAMARPDEAVEQAEAWLGLSVVRELLSGDTLGALDAARRAEALCPNEAPVALKLADMLRDLERWDEAEAQYDKALTLRPHWADAQYFRSILRFRQQRWQEAWTGYMARWGTDSFYRTAELSGKPPDDRPFWTGSPLEGRRLLVWAEQGVGDVLWSSRYLDLLLDRYPNESITFRVSSALYRYMQHHYGARCTVVCLDDILEHGGQFVLRPSAWPEYDVHTPLMNLPAALKQWEPIPDVRHTAAAPHPKSPLFTVGLVWAGAKGFVYDRMRSTELQDWRAVWSVPGVRLVSLQVGPRANDITGTPIEPMPIVRDYADTANVVANLDLVISVDTGVAHLASTLGVPTWWLIGKRDWRWSPASTNVWYTTARMWHRGRGNWEALLNRVARELHRSQHGSS